MRRLAIFLLPVLLTAACGGVPFAGGGTAEERATDDARKTAGLAGDKSSTRTGSGPRGTWRTGRLTSTASRSCG